MIYTFINDIQTWIENIGIDQQYVQILKMIIIIAVILFLALIADLITKKVLIGSIQRIVKKSKTKWDDILVQKKVIHRIAHFAPALVIYYASNISLEKYPDILNVVESGIYIYLIFIAMLALDAFFSALLDIYQTLPMSKDRPIKGYVQVIKIVIHSVGSILIISELLGKNPTAVFASLGALAAVLILVFRDTILGFVSSIQLSANKMVKPGDWISMPSREADGIVIEITVNTVKVRNWDKTISTIPTWALINESFQNWKGMQEMKGRRIARSVFIDIKSIKFANDEMLEKFKRFKLIKTYVEKRQEEIDEFNKKLGITDDDTVSRRRLTNVGIFRKYIEEYLAVHPKLHPNKLPYITLVRHLQPTEKGLPIQIYVFSKEYSWGEYEKVQADIFDHILAVISEFELRVFQNPSGDDFRSITQSNYTNID